MEVGWIGHRRAQENTPGSRDVCNLILILHSKQRSENYSFKVNVISDLQPFTCTTESDTLRSVWN
jgi:hypothetical protein